MVEPPASYLEPTVPPPPGLPASRQPSQLGLPAVLVWLVERYRFHLYDHRLPLVPSPRRTATVMARKKATADELDARAEANGYQREAYREEDSHRV
jgi:hypothetical protein